MAASKQDLIGWFNRGVSEGNARMVVWCDTYDWSDYPQYTNLTGDDLRRWVDESNGKNMKRLMEVYDLTMDREQQMAERRAFHY